jgi:AcrR family transcriptional regulator
MTVVVTRSTRDRPAKPPLSRQGVVEAGLAILQADGLSAVTMRAVAARLDTGPASLYAYVSGRDELLHEMLNTVMADVPVPLVDPDRWREQLKELLRATRHAMEAHPGIARVALGYVPTEQNTMVIGETMFALLRAGGIGPQAAAWALDVLALYVSATAYETSLQPEQGWGPDQIEEAVAQVRDAFESLPADRFPLLRTHVLQLTSGSGEDRFAYGMDVLINGLLATPEPAPPPP